MILFQGGQVRGETSRRHEKLPGEKTQVKTAERIFQLGQDGECLSSSIAYLFVIKGHEVYCFADTSIRGSYLQNRAMETERSSV